MEVIRLGCKSELCHANHETRAHREMKIVTNDESHLTTRRRKSVEQLMLAFRGKENPGERKDRALRVCNSDAIITIATLCEEDMIL